MSQGVPRYAPDLTFLTRDEDVELGHVVRNWRVEDPIKVALEAAAPPREKVKPCWEKLREETRRNDTRLAEIAVEISLLEKTHEEQRKPAEAPEEDLSGPFTNLTPEEEAEVDDCLYSTASGGKVLVLHEASNIEVSREKIRCLRPSGWLNDEVINLYLELLKERGKREPKRFLKCHFFNTFFYKKLACGKTGYDYKAVKRWTTSRKLGYALIECDKIFVPVHQNVHWCLAIINMKTKTIQYLDSLGGNDPRVPRMLAKYIVDEVKDKSNKEIDISSWADEESVDYYIPLQQNGWDCGMFMLKYIDFHCRGDSLSFSQEHMEYFRKRTAKEILRLRAD